MAVVDRRVYTTGNAGEMQMLICLDLDEAWRNTDISCHPGNYVVADGRVFGNSPERTATLYSERDAMHIVRHAILTLPIVPAFASSVLAASKKKPDKKDPPKMDRTKHSHKRVSIGYADGTTLRDEANAIVAMAFRNGPIEDLHAGKSSELLSDPELSRITDGEMKTLMINSCEQVAKLLELKENDPEGYYRQMLSYNHMYCRRWER